MTGEGEVKKNPRDKADKIQNHNKGAFIPFVSLNDQMLYRNFAQNDLSQRRVT